jgi:hypothetical protein
VSDVRTYFLKFAIAVPVFFRKNTTENKSPTKLMRNSHSEAIILLAVAAAFPNAISLERLNTSAGIGCNHVN